MIDIHTHGIGGLDTRTDNPEDILKIAEVHGAEGVGAIVLSIYPQPIVAMRANLLAVKGAMGWQERNGETGRGRGEESETKDLEKQCGKYATILGAYLEGPFLNPCRAGALHASSLLTPSLYGLDRLLDGLEDVVKIVAIAPELPGAPSVIHTMADRGIIASMGHSEATFAEAEAGFHAGARGVTHLFNAMRGFHHREPGLAGFGLINPHVYVEVIADAFHLHEETLRLIFSVKSHDRVMVISDSVKDTATDTGENAVRNKDGRLSGGSFAVAHSAELLLHLGYAEGLIRAVTSLNQERYLRLE